MKKIIDFSFFNIENLARKIKNIKKVFWFLGARIFFVIIILILIDILFGGFLLYKYVVLVEQQKVKIQNNSFKFEENLYQEVLEKIKSREDKFKANSEENYSNPFRAKTSIIL